LKVIHITKKFKPKQGWKSFAPLRYNDNFLSNNFFGALMWHYWCHISTTSNMRFLKYFYNILFIFFKSKFYFLFFIYLHCKVPKMYSLVAFCMVHIFSNPALINAKYLPWNFKKKFFNMTLHIHNSSFKKILEKFMCLASFAILSLKFFECFSQNRSKIVTF